MKWRDQTLTRKFTLLLIGFLVLQIAQIGAGIYGFWHLGREGAQVNEAGKQRLRTLLLGNLAREAVASGSWDQAPRAFFETTLAEYDAYFPWLKRLIHESSESSLQGHSLADLVVETKDSWEKDLRPLLVGIDPSRPQAARAALARYEALAPLQVKRLDRIVAAIDRDIRDDTLRLVLFQAAALGLFLLLGVIGTVVIRRIVIQPLRRLTATTRAIAVGAEDGPGVISPRDEIAVLADAFSRMTAAVADKTQRITALNEIAVQLTTVRTLRDLLEEIMRRGMLLTGAQAACIAFFNEQTRCFDKWITQGLSDHFVKNMSFRPGGLADEAFVAGTYVLSNDRPGTKHKLSRLTYEEGIQSFICLPLTSHASPLGVVYFYCKDRDFFLPDEIEILNTFAHLAAGAIESARLHEHTQDLAVTDKLTGLRNRRFFDQRLAEEIPRAARYAKPLSLLLLDIDDFKRVNDTYGHVTGDLVLQSLGGSLAGQLRQVDLAARYGGEEFAVILPETDFVGARLVAERIRRSAAGLVVRLSDGREIRLTVSLGVACFPLCGDSAERLVEHADQALYTAKQEGKNRVCLYREILKAQLEHEPHRIVDLLNQSLENIQPIVTAVSAKAAFFHNHTVLVGQAAMRLADALKLTEEDHEKLRLAARLHDIGMVTVPDAVLSKQSALTAEDWALIRQHSATSAGFLERVSALRHLAPIVRHHHERYDGDGYPDGLKGEAIPYLARVLAVADTYASMAGEWIGRKAKLPAGVKAQLAAVAGTQLNPQIVSAFVQVLDRDQPLAN